MLVEEACSGSTLSCWIRPSAPSSRSSASFTRAKFSDCRRVPPSVAGVPAAELAGEVVGAELTHDVEAAVGAGEGRQQGEEDRECAHD